MTRKSNPRDAASLKQLLAGFFDPAWYLSRYPDVAAGDLDPLEHFIRFGAEERRDPNRFFDSIWYVENNPDVAAGGMNPLLHYLQSGARELRRPNSGFDAHWYVRQHPEAAANPLLYHLRVGLAAGYRTEGTLDIQDCLPSRLGPPRVPVGVFVDVVFVSPSRNGLLSVLSDRRLPLARVIVVADGRIDAGMTPWLKMLANDGQIHLIRATQSVDFAELADRGIKDADGHDVVLLDGDTVLPSDWLPRLIGHAYAERNIATVSPLSATARFPGFDEEQGIRPPPGIDPLEMDAASRLANQRRRVDLPVALGRCVYIRAEALRLAGGFLADADLHGDDAAVDFCLRAAAPGWRHTLACDLFVDTPPRPRQKTSYKRKTSTARPADYRQRVQSYLATNAMVASRFALTATLFARSGQSVILMISHDHGGGVRRHIDGLVERHTHAARFLLLEGGSNGVTLSVPNLPGHPVLTLPHNRIEDLTLLLQAMKVTRVHIHHLLNVNMDVRRLLHRLNVPFDLTVHDYFAICPQINLLKWPEGLYCGEPGSAACNACIAENNNHGARDIFSWRHEHAWQFVEAERVICPSEDVRNRLERHGLAANTIVQPHEQQAATIWQTVLPKAFKSPLRVVLLGVLANHKGARTVASVAEAADPCALRIHLIGDLENTFPAPAAERISVTGPYKDKDLPALLREADPHVFWFPSSAPETYSYTLSTAIESGLPIVATNLGALPERLAGRPNTWLVDHRATAQEWIAVFSQVAKAIQEQRSQAPARRKPVLSEFYSDEYLAPAVRKAPVRRKIVIIPERQENGALTTRAYVRLLLPLQHLAATDGLDLLIADPETGPGQQADLVVTQRRAIDTPAAVDRLAEQCQRAGARLVYDLDDDLLTVPASHPDTAASAMQNQAVRRMLSIADEVWVSSPELAARMCQARAHTTVLETRADERIWDAVPAVTPFWAEPVRILCIGSGRRDADLAIIEPALTRLKAEYGDHVTFDIVGMTTKGELPQGLNRLPLTTHAARSYPGFMHWLTTTQPSWTIGLAPLADTEANRFATPIKLLEYAAMGLWTFASDVPAYRGTIADGPAGQLVANTPIAWYTALSWVIRDQTQTANLWAEARSAFQARGTLASQSDTLRKALFRGQARTKRAGTSRGLVPPAN